MDATTVKKKTTESEGMQIIRTIHDLIPEFQKSHHDLDYQEASSLMALMSWENEKRNKK